MLSGPLSPAQTNTSETASMQPRDAFKYHSNMFPSCWRECSKAICFWELLKAGTFVLMCGSRLIDRKDLKKLEDWLSKEWGRRSANLENPLFSNSGGKILVVAVSADVNHCECPDSLFFSQDGKNTVRIAKAVQCHFQFSSNNHCHIFFFIFVISSKSNAYHYRFEQDGV